MAYFGKTFFDDLRESLLGREIRVIVVGKTGNGKSSVINTIAGKKLFKALPSTESVTTECQSAEIKVGEKKLFIVDTPGLYDTELKNETTLTEIGKVMGMTAPGFHAFIVVLKVDRFTEEEHNTFKLLLEKFGPELYERTVILFTQLDALKHDDIPFQTFIRDNIQQDLKDIIKDCHDRTIGFNNRAEGEDKLTQVQELMAILADILKSKRYTCYTNDFYKKAEKEIDRERKQRIEQNKSKSVEQVTHEIRKEIETDKGYGKGFSGWWRKNICVIS